VAAAVVCVVLVSLKPGALSESDYSQYDNPLGSRALAGVASAAEGAGRVLFLVALVAAAASVVVRFRRSRGVERQQLKWVTYTVGVMAAGYLVGLAVPDGLLSSLGTSIAVLALCAFPVAIGIAVLRYRLYEIDRLINRTLVYASVTMLLGAAYAGLVLLGQAVFSSFAGGSDLAIAASTLVVAALFLPVRARVQGLVDRRFYRRRYDAQRTLHAFGARLREEVDMATLDEHLRNAVAETMQPSQVSLWLREKATS
jgi:hypothetical protein